MERARISFALILRIKEMLRIPFFFLGKMSFVICSHVYLNKWMEVGAYRSEVSSIVFCFFFFFLSCQEEG